MSHRRVQEESDELSLVMVRETELPAQRVNNSYQRWTSDFY